LLGERSLRIAAVSIEPAHSGALASEIFSDHVARNVFVEARSATKRISRTLSSRSYRISRISAIPCRSYFFFHR
jgi:hypothetical protein